MPNWELNTLKVKGTEAAIDAFLARIKSEESDFDFNSIRPMPPIIRNTGSGYRKFDGVEHKVWYQPESLTEEDYRRCESQSRPFTEEELTELSFCGATNWYDWSVKNWGTKWNACRVKVTRKKGEATIKFETAWGPPRPIIAQLPFLFTDLHFTHRSKDIG